MKKHCEFCTKEYEAKRSDSKYCSNSCKQEAYMMRKANPQMTMIAQNTIQHTDNRNGYTHSRKSSKNVKSSIPISASHLDKLLSGHRHSQDILLHLLTEKDKSSEIRAQKASLESELRFLERDLRYERDKNDRLEREISSLNSNIISLKQLEANTKKGLGTQVIDFCKDNPDFVKGLFIRPTIKPKLEKVAGNSLTNVDIDASEIIQKMEEQLDKNIKEQNPTQEQIDQARKDIVSASKILNIIQEMSMELGITITEIYETLESNKEQLKFFFKN